MLIKGVFVEACDGPEGFWHALIIGAAQDRGNCKKEDNVGVVAMFAFHPTCTCPKR